MLSFNNAPFASTKNRQIRSFSSIDITLKLKWQLKSYPNQAQGIRLVYVMADFISFGSVELRGTRNKRNL